MNLPVGQQIARPCAETGHVPVMRFAVPQGFANLTRRQVAIVRASCLYRNPSPYGRRDLSPGQPPHFFTASQCCPHGPVPAGTGGVVKNIWTRVFPAWFQETSTCHTTKEKTGCKIVSELPLFLRSLRWLPAVTVLESRLSLVAVLAAWPQNRLMGTLLPALSSEPQPISPIAVAIHRAADPLSRFFTVRKTVLGLTGRGRSFCIRAMRTLRAATPQG